jgi:hypothetical protein
MNYNSSMGSRCRAPDQAGPSVWYRFDGSGASVEILLCNDDSDLDSGINIYQSSTGSCENISCGLNSRFENNPCQGAAAAGSTSINAKPGVVYFIEIITFGEGNTGDTGKLTVSRG